MFDTVASLIAAGIPKPWLETVATHVGPELLPLQRDVFSQTGVLEGRENVLVSAPTASGKTLVAELAALSQINRGRRVLYLVPTRALAEEKAREFAERWTPHGVVVACSTRDRTEHDRRIVQGKVHLTVAVYEKAISLLARQASALAGIGLLVADEAQVLGDADRGAGIDLLLTRWKVAPTRPQLLVLSAVLGDPESFARWLGIRLWRSDMRPVPLREGVLEVRTGVFRWRDSQSGQGGRENLLPPNPEPDERRARLDTLTNLCIAAGPTIVFCATRGEATSLAMDLAHQNPFPSATVALEEIKTVGHDMARERVEEVLEAGIGLHTGDMTGPQRRVVESAFQRLEAQVLVATSTLDQGVNLAAACVIQSPHMVSRDPLSGAFALVPLSRSRFANQGGRAGRKNLAFGRSVAFAMSPLEAEQLWKALIQAPLDILHSPLGAGSLINAIAELVFEHRAVTAEELMAFLLLTEGGGWRGRAVVEARVREDLAAGAEQGLWIREADGVLSLTALGEGLAASGVEPRTALRWARLLEGCDKCIGLAAPLFLITLADEWRDEPVGVERTQWRRNTWPAGLEERLSGGDRLSVGLRDLLGARGGAPFLHHRAARHALLLDDWLAGEPLAELELAHSIPSGRLMRIATQASWLARAAAEVAGAMRCPSAVIDVFEGLAKKLAELEASVPAPVPEPTVEFDLSGKVDTAQSENPAPKAEAIRLRFLADDAGAVLFDGRRCELAPLPFQLLVILAQNAAEGVSYQRINQELWPDTAVEPQQISHHRRSVERALAPDGGTRLIRTRHRWGLVLDLKPEEIEFEEREAAMQAG